MANQKPEPINFEFEGETFKTYSDWFKEKLPPEVAARAIHLMGTSAGRGRSRNEECSDIAEALQLGFTWSKTKEGHAYWEQLHDYWQKLLSI